MRILIADDDDIALELVERALTDWGHEVHTARDGREALEIVCRESIRMVISDWMMPAMDGIELCEQIRTAPVPGYVYIILLTSRHEKADIIEGLSAGADDFIVKPFDPTELRVRVRVGERIVSLETQHVAVFAMAKLAESRDPETGHHLERIRNYARVLAGELSVSPAIRTCRATRRSFPPRASCPGLRAGLSARRGVSSLRNQTSSFWFSWDTTSKGD